MLYYLVSVGSNGHSEGPCQAKVSQLDDSAGADEQVLRLEVSVEDSVGVAERNAVQDLVDVALGEGQQEAG